jgi:TIR domain-containing protein
MGDSMAGVRIFISYSRQDKDIAFRVADELTQAGCRVWIDRGLLGGERFDAEIVKAINRAEVVLLIVSDAAVESDWVNQELEQALEWRKRIIPVIWRMPTAGESQVHEVLEHVHALDLSVEHERGVAELIRAIHTYPLVRRLAEHMGDEEEEDYDNEEAPLGVVEQLIHFTMVYVGMVVLSAGVGSSFGLLTQSLPAGLCAAGAATALTTASLRRAASVVGLVVAGAVGTSACVLAHSLFAPQSFSQRYVNSFDAIQRLDEWITAHASWASDWTRLPAASHTYLGRQLQFGLLAGLGMAFLLILNAVGEGSESEYRLPRLGRLGEVLGGARAGAMWAAGAWALGFVLGWLFDLGFGAGEGWQLSVAGLISGYLLGVGVANMTYICLLEKRVDATRLLSGAAEFFERMIPD